jgi:hypothetical protein
MDRRPADLDLINAFRGAEVLTFNSQTLAASVEVSGPPLWTPSAFALVMPRHWQSSRNPIWDNHLVGLILPSQGRAGGGLIGPAAWGRR